MQNRKASKQMLEYCGAPATNHVPKSSYEYVNINFLKNLSIHID